MTSLSPASGDPTEIVHAQRAWTEAVLTNDADEIAEHLDDDGVLVTPDGIVTAAQFLGAIRAAVLNHTTMGPASSPDGSPRIRIFGDVAVFTQRVVSTEVDDGAAHDNDEWTTTVFVRDDGGWRVGLIHLTPAR